MLRKLCAVLAIGVAGAAVSTPVAAAASGTPYRDPAAHGSIGLCDRAGHQITHGSITATPFAWRAVSSVAAPAGYAAGGTATLLAYQPRHGVPSGEWSGDELTSASRYTDPAHPTAAATGGDESLQGFITEFSPRWDGLLQLRLYLGAPDEPIYSLSYPSLDIQVTGNSWHVVDGTTVSCHSGRSVSLESIVLTPHPPAAATPASPSRAGSASTPRTTDSNPVAATSSAAAPAASGSGHGAAILIAVIAGVLLLAGGSAAVRRRSLKPSAGPTEPTKEGR
jgi:hypothetical protein